MVLCYWIIYAYGCYKNNNYNGIELRNIKMEDITKVMRNSNWYTEDYGKTKYTYNFNAPYIWTTYEKGTLTSNTEALNNKSIAYELTTRTNSTTTTITPYLTAYHTIHQLNKDCFPKNIYYELVMENNGFMRYYISSRFCNPDEGTLYFRIRTCREWMYSCYTNNANY